MKQPLPTRRDRKLQTNHTTPSKYLSFCRRYICRQICRPYSLRRGMSWRQNTHNRTAREKWKNTCNPALLCRSSRRPLPTSVCHLLYRHCKHHCHNPRTIFGFSAILPHRTAGLPTSNRMVLRYCYPLQKQLRSLIWECDKINQQKNARKFRM